MKNNLYFPTIFVIVAFALCNCSDNSVSGEGGPLNPPSWIQGKWEGGSPFTLKLEFTRNNCFNSRGNEEFAGFRESENSDTRYALSKDNQVSVFRKVNDRSMDWYVSNGNIANTTRMHRK